jgi:hypothetical protein
MNGSTQVNLQIPAVRLVLVKPTDTIPQTPAIAPIANLRQQRIEQFLDLKDLAAKTRQTYAQQLKCFSDWID